jgi:hypothetical protein
MPRTRLGSALDELEVDGQGHVVGQHEAALGQRGVPVEAELRAVDDRLELEAELGVAERVLDGAGDRAGRADALGVALDRQVARDGDAAVADRDVGRLEADPRVLLGVEELRRLQVFSSLTTTLSTGTEPTSLARPSSSAISWASKAAKLPRNVASMCLTANAVDEWTGSDV